MQYTRQHDFTSGTVIDSEQVDGEFNAVASVVNGNIDSDNIKDGAVGSDQLASSFADSIFKPGMIQAYGGTTAPGGWLMCDGSSQLRGDYLNLYAVIGTAFGTADSTHFNLPDLRGRFPRGVAHSQTTDPDRATRTAMATGGNTGDNVGSVQTDTYYSHAHTGSTGTVSADHDHNLRFSRAGTGSYVETVAVGGAAGASWVSAAAIDGINANHTHGFTSDASGGNETRPENIYVEYIIKI